MALPLVVPTSKHLATGRLNAGAHQPLRRAAGGQAASGARMCCVGLLSALVLLSGCGGDETAKTGGGDAAVVAKSETPPPKPRKSRRKRPQPNLSDYGLFVGDMANLEPAPGVMPYDLNTPLFSDFAWKHRVVKLPAGTHATYHETGTFEFPVGTIIAKTFYFPHDFNDPSKGRRLIETRILLHRESGWIGVPYVWNDEQTDAVSEVAGATVDVSWVHYDGTQRSNPYIVPNANDCKRCHKNEVVEPIGPRARHLNKEFAYHDGVQNQLARWAEAGILTGAPDDPATAPQAAVWNDPLSGSVADRARAWLDINCAHCHNSRGPARNSGLYLNVAVTDPYQLGVYKTPVAAGRGSGGRQYDVVPGQPDESIMMFRLEATHPGIVMPEFGRTLVDDESNALIRQWIEEIEVPAGFDITNAIGEFQSLSEEQLAQFASDVLEKGDPARGETVFHRRRLNCFRCHAIGGVGEQVGPDLAAPRDDKSLEYLIESVLLPNKAIRKGYETATVVTEDGQAYAGVVIEENDAELVLRDLTRPEIRLPKTSIDERSAGNSLMPTNVVAMQSREDVIDLLRFLWELGQQGVAETDGDRVVRRWEVLDPLPQNIDRVEPDAFIADTATRRDLTWEPAYSRLSGAVDLETAMIVPPSDLRVVRCTFEATDAGTIAIRLNATDGLRLWLDGAPVAAEELSSLRLEPGPRTLSFWVDLANRGDETLSCEIVPAGETPAKVNLRPATTVP